MARSALADLLASGIPEPAARQLVTSGHYRDASPQEVQQALGVARPGWLVRFPTLSGDGLLLVDGPGSAPFVRARLTDGKEPKYLTASGAGCRPYFSPLLSHKARNPKAKADIDITEGEKKTDAACSHGYDTIGLSGVDCFRDKRCERGDMLPELEAIEWKGRTVRLVFDSDVAINAGVQSALRRLAFTLTHDWAKVLVTTIPCEIPSGPGNPTPEKWKNGLDDFIARHGADAYRIVRSRARECVVRTKDEEGNTKLEWIWEPEPSGRGSTREKALLARCVFKEAFTVDPNLGALHWCGTHWQILDGKPEQRLARPFLHWCDAMGWQDTTLGAVPSQLIEELREERHWNPPGRLAFVNGTLDTATGKFFQGHRREDNITILHPYRYDPTAQCPRWMHFLPQALGDSEAAVKVLRAAIRWTIEPKDRTRPFPVEYCFDVGGHRGSGKGTASEVVGALVGGTEGGAARLDMASLDNPAALFQLVGKRMAFDPDASGHMANAGIFNAIVSNEPINVKKLYVNEHSTRLGVVVWRFFNDQITVSGGSEEGIGRRSIPLTFSNPTGARDRTLKAALLAELPGIFTWAWSMPLEEALQALATAGHVEGIREAAIEAAKSRNPKLRFLAEEFPAGRKGITAEELFRTWKWWCVEEGHHHGNKSRFSADIQKVAGKPKRVGQEKQTTYEIPAMDGFDYAAHLGLAPTAGVDVDSTQVDVDSEMPGRRPPESASTQRPLNVQGNVQQNPVPYSFSLQVDVDLEEKKEGQAREEIQEAERGQAGDLRGKGLEGANSASSASTPSAAKPITVDGKPGWSLPGAMPAGNGPTVKVLCTDPKEQSQLIERRRIALAP
jgi:phage/plasmid-associated DNA primase